MIITNINITIDAWIEALEKYTFEQLIFKTSAETWSVGQMSNHLLNDTNYYIEQIRICLKSNDHEFDESSPEAKKMFKQNEFPNIAIEGSPNNAFVKQPVSKEQLIRDFQNLKADLNNLSYMILKSQFKGKTKHPGLDYFSAIEWLQFADMHFRHHFRQKARLDEFLKKSILNFMKIISILFVLVASVAFGQPQSVKNTNSGEGKPIHQLRIYEIFKNNKQAFHDRFQDHAMRIMKSYDFKIVAIWESEKADKVEFVYLLEWPNEKVMNESWTKFRADNEWIEIKKKFSNLNGELVGEIEDRILILQDYSPRTTLLK